MVGFDDSDDVLEAERAERLPHDLARGLGRQPTSPCAWMKVVAEFNLWTVMLEWLQPTVADQSSALAILDGPEAEAEHGVGLNVLADLPLDVFTRACADPLRHQWVLVDLRERIKVARM